jgi:hypothetical protein
LHLTWSHVKKGQKRRDEGLGKMVFCNLGLRVTETATEKRIKTKTKTKEKYKK